MEKSIKKFRYRFSILSYVLFGLGIALALFMIAYNVYRISSEKVTGEYVGSLLLSMSIGVIFLAIAISVLTFSFYTVTKTEIKTRLGLFNSGIKLSDLTEIIQNKKTNKLSVFYKDGEFSNVVISPKYFESFIKEIKTFAPHIILKEFTDNI